MRGCRGWLTEVSHRHTEPSRQPLEGLPDTDASGTPVTFYRGGRFITVPVIDRGPFRNGVAWDLTAAAARKLGMASTTRLRSVH